MTFTPDSGTNETDYSIGRVIVSTRALQKAVWSALQLKRTVSIAFAILNLVHQTSVYLASG
jgi:hypothetical protein